MAIARCSGLDDTLLLNCAAEVRDARRRSRPAMVVTLSGTENDLTASWTEATPGNCLSDRRSDQSETRVVTADQWEEGEEQVEGGAC